MVLDIIKYFLYDIALNVFFNSVQYNFPSSRVIPIIGQHYSKILDPEMNECYYDCILIPISQLSYYGDLVSDYSEDNENVSDQIAFGALYKKYCDLDEAGSTEDYDEYAEVHFEKDEIENLVFYK